MRSESPKDSAHRSILASILPERRRPSSQDPGETGTEQHATADLDRPLVHRTATVADSSHGETGQLVDGVQSSNGAPVPQPSSPMITYDDYAFSSVSGRASPMQPFGPDLPLEVDTQAAIFSATRRGFDEDLGTEATRPLEHGNGLPVEGPRPIETRSPLEVKQGFEQHKIHHIGFELSQGDTLVLVDFPSSRDSDVRRSVDCSGIAYGDAKFRVHSENLLKTESTRFREMLAPSYQFRVQRRRKLVNKLPEGIKYVLDMTPPVEGDDIVFQMTELSLTPGVIDWWKSHALHGVDMSLVTGHDDICSCIIRRKSFANKGIPPAQSPQDSTTDSQAAASASSTNPTNAAPNNRITVEQMLRKKAVNDNQVCETEEFRRIPDYCPFRHCCGIIRLMMMIEGHIIDLNSATKVWTLFALAKIWDCTATVQHLIGRWLLSNLNMKFIEVLPEEALEIGYALKLKDVTGAAFRILVNELALKEADPDHRTKWTKQVTVFGRRTGDLSDELKNIIEHAGRALVDRVTQLHAAVHNPDMFDFWDIAAWRRLRRLEQYLKCIPDSDRVQLAREAISDLMTALPARVTTLIDRAMVWNLEESDSLLRGMDADRTSYVEPRDFETLASILRGFNPIQKMMTAIPYMSLSNELETHLFWRVFASLDGSPAFASLVDRAENRMYSLFTNEPHTRNRALLDDVFGPGQWQALHVSWHSSFVSLDSLDTQIKEALRPNFQTVWIRHFPIPLNLTRHLLLNLDINELKYLPLWAGGFDDGSGGVYEDHLPDAHLGAIGPGPFYRTGITVPSSDGSISESMMEEIRGMNVHGSTTAGSVDVHDSISTVYRPDRVIVDDGASVGTEQFTDTSSDFARARFSVPAEHQATGQAIDYMVDTETDDSASVTTEQIFAGDDSDDSTEKGSVAAGVDEDTDFVMLE